jgi:hypothetical protein
MRTRSTLNLVVSSINSVIIIVIYQSYTDRKINGNVYDGAFIVSR